LNLKNAVKKKRPASLFTCVSGPSKVEAANAVQGLVIQAEGAVSVLEERLGGQEDVILLNNGSGNLAGLGSRCATWICEYSPQLHYD
jgi:hypothetical protein